MRTGGARRRAAKKQLDASSCIRDGLLRCSSVGEAGLAMVLLDVVQNERTNDAVAAGRGEFCRSVVTAQCGQISESNSSTDETRETQTEMRTSWTDTFV